MVLTGFGYLVRPEWPFAFAHAADIPGAEHAADGSSLAVIQCGESGEPQISAGPDAPGWRIETARYGVNWPRGFSVESTGEGDPFAPFLLWGPDRSLIWIQGPILRERLTSLDALIGPGQSVADRDDTPGRQYIDLDYQEEGAAWRQRHRLLDLDADHLLVVTAQAPLARAGVLLLAATEVADSFSVTPAG